MQLPQKLNEDERKFGPLFWYYKNPSYLISDKAPQKRLTFEGHRNKLRIVGPRFIPFLYKLHYCCLINCLLFNNYQGQR